MRTQAILKPLKESVNFTLNQETDARTALVRGLCEYMQDLETSVFGQRTVRFNGVFENWADFEENVSYPSAYVFAEEAGEYEPNKNTPSVELIDKDFPYGVYLVNYGEYVQKLSIHLWATDTVERMALVGMLESELNPVEWKYGLTLILPHYFNATGTFELLSCRYEDSSEQSMQRYRLATLVVEGRVPLIRINGYPTARILSDVTVNNTGV